MTVLSTVASPIDSKLAAGTLPASSTTAAAGSAPALGRAVPAPAEADVGARRTHWWRELLIVIWLCWVYDAVNNFAPLRLGPALAHGRGILSLESSLGIAPERSLDSWLAGHHTLGVAVSYYYDNAHFIVTLGLLGFAWWRRAAIFRPLRNSLVLINLLGFVVFWLYPVAPPRMLGGFTDVVASSHAVGSWHSGALASEANQLAAMPSLHIAWAVWCTVVVWRSTANRWLRALAVAYPMVTGFAVLATGNHYVLDLAGGLLVAAAAIAVVAGAPRIRAAFS
jgi:hypothetical protein